MGQLIDGTWYADATNRATEETPEPTSFDGRIGPGGDFPADPDRYHLYVSRACPWAHGAVLVRRLLGLDAVTVDVVDPVRRDDGWEFTPAKDGCTPDRVTGADYLREVYTAADPEYTGRVTVPVLWDTEAGTIVSDESIDVMRTLADAFGDRADRDLYPEGRRDDIDALVEEMYDPLNRGVYRAGFAESQADYEAAVADVFAALDRYEERLADRRYLLGDDLTLADLRLFPTLVRFDAVYHTHFGCNVRRLVDYPNLWGYTRDIYGTGGPGRGEGSQNGRAGDGESRESAVAGTVNLDHIKAHYYRSHRDLNPTGFVPVGPDLDFGAPHDRADL